MPMLIGIDAVNNLIALEDLGKTNDYRFVWFRTKITEEELVQLVNYLNGLHQSFQKTVVDGITNTEMRTLNYEHIFWISFREKTV
jgi:5-methylthioribose kinase